MPGCEANIEDIIEAVKDGSLKLGYLHNCCKRMLEVDMKCSSFEGVGSYIADYPLKDFVTCE